jgi:hypothetical protein
VQSEVTVTFLPQTHGQINKDFSFASSTTDVGTGLHHTSEPRLECERLVMLAREKERVLHWALIKVSMATLVPSPHYSIG